MKLKILGKRGRGRPTTEEVIQRKAAEMTAERPEVSFTEALEKAEREIQAAAAERSKKNKETKTPAASPTTTQQQEPPNKTNQVAEYRETLTKDMVAGLSQAFCDYRAETLEMPHWKMDDKSADLLGESYDRLFQIYFPTMDDPLKQAIVGVVIATAGTFGTKASLELVERAKRKRAERNG